MSLLAALNLPTSPSPSPAGPGAMPPPPVVGAGAGADPHAEAAKMKREIEKQRKDAAATLKTIDAATPKLQKAIDAASGAKKAELEASRKALDEQAEKAQKAHDQAVADLEAIDSPATRREQLVSLLARRKSGAWVAPAVEVDVKGLDPSGKGLNRDVTTTTTGYANGKSTVDKASERRSVGVDGVTVASGRDTETRVGDTAVRKSEEKKTNVSAGGKLTHETKKSIEVETADGRTAKVEKSSSTELSTKGGSRSETRAMTGLDGSATSTTKSVGVERGDGKVGASVAGATTKTDAAGHETTKSGKASAGMVAGKDGYGGYASAESGVKTKSKSGVETGAVAGLDANVVANISAPSGDPPRHTLSLKVNLGASMTLSAGKSKEGKGGFSVEAKGGASVYMTKERKLGEAEAADYVKALKQASAGGEVAATWAELQIVSAGVREGWAVAQQMWKSGGKPLSKEAIAALRSAGDSIEIGGSASVGGSAKVDVKAVSVAAGITETRDFSTKATRNDAGGVDVEGKAGKTRETSGKVGINVGVVGAEFGASRSVRTTLGYTITIDPKNDPDGRIFAALGQCRSDADYEAFVVKWKAKITVTGRTVGRAEDEASTIGITVGGKGVSIGSHQGIARETTTDGSGAFKSEKVVGSAGGGGKIGGWGDSGEDQATAERDAEGNASLDLSHTKNDTNYGKAISGAVRNVPLVGPAIVGAGEKKPAGGALQTAAGGDADDHSTKDVAGLRLSTADLKKIGQIAVSNRSRWNGAVRRWQELDDWKATGDAIARAKGDPGVVATELAKFIGGDRIHRLETVERFLRPGGDVGLGAAYEFPDALKGKRADYERLVEAPFDAGLQAIAQSQGAPKAAEQAKKLITELDALYKAFEACDDFARPGAKGEMLSTMTKRRTALAEAARTYAGQTSADDEKKAKEEAVERMLRLCLDHKAEQDRVFKQLADLLGDRSTFRVAAGDLLEAQPAIRQLRDLHAKWRSDYDEAVKLAKAIGMAASRYEQEALKPNLVSLQRFEKAAFM